MKSYSQPIIQKKTLTSVIIDLSALALIYFVPTLSHLMNLPLYLIEPMRLMLVIAMVHTSKNNAYIIALTLPLFSYLISSHPVFPKMILIAFELSLNVYLFYTFSRIIKIIFPSILLSIVLSKTIYYIIKFGLIQMAILQTGLISTAIYIQVITTLVFSTYLYFFYGKKKGEI